MSAFRRFMGLDGVDVIIHLVTTGFLAGLVDAISTNPDAKEGNVFLILAASTVVFGVRRHFALKRQARFPETTGEMAAERVEELESRVAELEQGQMRMHELEERVDFAERMLTQQREGRQLASREDP